MKVQETRWYRERPLSVQRAIDRWPPDQLYRIKSTGQVAFLYSYGEAEDGTCTTCTVCVTRRYNPTCLRERSVFGVPLEDLEGIGPPEAFRL